MLISVNKQTMNILYLPSLINNLGTLLRYFFIIHTVSNIFSKLVTLEINILLQIILLTVYGQ